MATDYQNLREKRNLYLQKMERISTRSSDMNETDHTSWRLYEKEINKIDREIDQLRLRNYNKNNHISMRNTNLNEVLEFRDWLKNSHEDNSAESFKVELRADPILTSTDAGLIQKEVGSKVDTLLSPGEGFLRNLGVQIIPDLKGTFCLPYMDEDTGEWAAENVDGVSANMIPQSLTLNARRVTHSQSVTVETLAQSTPGLYQGILNNLTAGLWNGIVKDLLLDISTNVTGRYVTNGNRLFDNTVMVQMEASIGTYSNTNLKYVTTPSVKAYLKTVARIPNTEVVWSKGDIVNTYPAFGHQHVAPKQVIFGDFSRSYVGIWGPFTIVLDPYTNAKKGVINLTAVALADTGVSIKKAFCILTDASIR